MHTTAAQLCPLAGIYLSTVIKKKTCTSPASLTLASTTCNKVIEREIVWGCNTHFPASGIFHITKHLLLQSTLPFWHSHKPIKATWLMCFVSLTNPQHFSNGISQSLGKSEIMSMRPCHLSIVGSPPMAHTLDKRKWLQLSSLSFLHFAKCLPVALRRY